MEASWVSSKESWDRKRVLTVSFLKYPQSMYVNHLCGIIYEQQVYSCCCYSVVQLCSALCDPMNCSTPGFPVHHQLPELVQTYIHWVDNATQPSHPLLPLSSCLQSFPASGCFLMNQLFASGAQSIEASASASVLQSTVREIHFPINNLK